MDYGNFGPLRVGTRVLYRGEREAAIMKINASLQFLATPFLTFVGTRSGVARNWIGGVVRDWVLHSLEVPKRLWLIL